MLCLYRSISDVLRELFDDWDNDASRRESSQRFTASESRKTTAASHFTLHGCFSCHSKLVRAPHVNQNYSVGSGSSPGDVHHRGTFVTASPRQNRPFHAPPECQRVTSGPDVMWHSRKVTLGISAPSASQNWQPSYGRRRRPLPRPSGDL